MSSRRCSFCGLFWPLAGRYVKCPMCHEDTWPATSPSMTQEQADELVQDHSEKVAELQAAYASAGQTKAQKDFEEYYVARVAATIDEEWARFGAV